MRFTVTAADGTQVALATAAPRNPRDWWLTGAEGWLGTPAPREQPVAGVGRDGDSWPATLTQGARAVTLYGEARCASTVEAGAALARLGRLFGQELEVVGEGPAGALSAHGFLADDPAPQLLSRGLAVAFTLVITCPDPLKYGPEAAYPVAGGSAALVNGGTAPSWPRVRVEGPVTRLALSLGGQQVRWAGDAASLDLDLADMEPSAGAVTVDNAFAVPPGTHEVRVSTDGAATLYLRSAWR